MHFKDGEELEAVERRTPKLNALREDLERTIQWNPELTPAFEPIPHPKVTERMGRGFYGEDLMARTAVSRGEIILDFGSGIEDVNKGGPDLVTLDERDGRLFVKFYDNKALTSRENVSSVPALGKNFDASLEDYREQWKGLAGDPSRSDAERQLFSTALECVEQGQYARVVTNQNSRVTGVTERVDSAGIEFENMARNTSTPKLK